MEHDSIRNSPEIKRAGESIFGRKHGVEAYDLLKREYDTQEIIEKTGMEKKSFRRYVKDWRDEDLIRLRNNSYEFTEKGEFIYNMIKYFDLGMTHGMDRVNEMLEERVE